MRGFFVILLSALVACKVVDGSVEADWPFPVKDDQYVEIVAGRHVCGGNTPVEGWGTLPLANPSNVQVVDGDVVVLSDDSGKYFAATLPTGRSGADPVMQSGGSLTATLNWQPVTGINAPGTLIANANGQVRAFVTVNSFQLASCDWSTLKTVSASPSCTLSGSPISASFGKVNDTAVVSDGSRFFLATESMGLVVVESTKDGLQHASVNGLEGDMWAVALSPREDLLACGNSTVVGLVNASATSWPNLLRWDWVTNVTSGEGGVYDDEVTAMTFDSSGTLWVGTQSVLNARWPNGSVSRFGGVGEGGLPWGNITSMDSFESDIARAVHIGTSRGVVVINLPVGDNETPALPVSWQYLYGRRWLAGPMVRSLSCGEKLTQVALAVPGEWGEGCGLSVFEYQPWTLREKAVRMRNIQERHDRHGLVSECILTPSGNLTSCKNGPSDNNGLWTSLVALSEVHRYVATKDKTALASAQRWYDGMALLNEVTNIHGLIARSAIGPNEPRQSGPNWINSTNHNLQGWMFKDDASSDEVAGHTYGWGGAIAALWNETDPDAVKLRTQAATYISRIATYIVENGFTLVDVTGKPTRWGHWNPDYINFNRSWSDERGLNSAEILATISAGHDAAVLFNNQTMQSTLQQAYDYLVSQGYLENLVNNKIEAPCDDNYSDNELTYTSFYPALVSKFAASRPEMTDSFRRGMWRTWDFVKGQRSDWWNAISVSLFHSTTAAPGSRELDTQEAVDTINDAIWNLQTWPLEEIQWSSHNAHRLDIYFRPGVNRDYQTHQDGMTVLPANERTQGRWNGNPYALETGDGGGTEMDAGAWMAPYGMLLGHNLLQP